MNKALEILLVKEWTLGNGQCMECLGHHKGWVGHPNHPDLSTIGHKLDCGRGMAIRELGGDTCFIGELSST